MANIQKIPGHQAQHIGSGQSTPTQIDQGQSGGREISSIISKFGGKGFYPKTTKSPTNSNVQQVSTRKRSVRVYAPPVMQRVTEISIGPKNQKTAGPTQPPKKYNYKEYVQKFGSKTANLYEIEKLGVKVPERSPISSTDVLEYLLDKDEDGVIKKSWTTMKMNGKVDDINIKNITEKIEEIFNEQEFPFTQEQLTWINETMAGKVIIARSTGDEDSVDTPNAGGNESVLFVEPDRNSVKDAMKEVVLSYFGADSLRNRIVGDGVKKVLSGLPKMPVLLMEMISEPIKDSSKEDQGDPPPIGIAMSTDKLEFTGGEDFHFVSISSAVGPGVNEGNGLVEVDETFVMQSNDGTPLLIYQKPSVKLDRIRAVKDKDGVISSKLEKNSTQLAYGPSLSRDEVRSLVTSSDKIKTLNGGKTTEVEAVVGGDGEINFVQHRAIPDERSKVDPTYVDIDKATGHSKVFQYTTVVPKSGDSLVITNWSQVCFAETMKEAEAMFDWKGGSQKVVIVRQPDGSNSHPAVNFGSYKKDVNGKKEPNPIPCLVVPNFDELVAQKKTSLAENQPLIVDGQSQKVFVWTDETFNSETAIQDGRISHHIGLETSVTDDEIQKVVDKLKTTDSDQLSWNQKPELSSIFNDLDPVLQQYTKQIKQYETLLTKNADIIHNSEGLKCRLDTIKENLEAVKDALYEVMKGNPKYTFDPGTHARLLIVKFFESSMHEVDHFPELIEAEKSASRYLQALKGSPVDQPVFGDQVHGVKDGLTGPLMMRWKRFLTLAEQSDLSQSQIADFKNMIADLDKIGVTANWMSTVFDQKYADIMPPGRTGTTPIAPKAKELLLALVKDYQDTAPFLTKQQSLQNHLEQSERSVADFATPSKFEKAFSQLKALAEPFIKDDWPTDLNDNPLKKAVQIQNLGRLIEVYDSSIKTLKSSSLPPDQLLKAELEMLETFKELHDSLFKKIKLPGLGQTLNGKKKFINGLNNAFTEIKKEVENEKDLLKLDAQSRCGAAFNVNTCLSASGAKDKPSNVEEMFTTLHQSLEAIRSGLMVGGSDYSIDTPKELQNLLAAVPKLAMQTAMKIPPILVGRDITSTGATYIYNMPVLDHGIKVRATYEKPTPENPQGKTSLEIDFYAANSGGRLKDMATLTNQFGFGKDVVWGENQMKAKFEIGNEQDIPKVTTLINEICAYSMAPRFDIETNRNTGTLKKTIVTANDPTSGLFPVKRQRILNDFLNVVFGSVSGTSQNDGKITYGNRDHNIRLTPSGPPLTFNDGLKIHALELDKERLGLDQVTYDQHKDQLRTVVEKEVLQGSRKFTFKIKNKTYAVDLNRNDLGLSAKDLKSLSLNPKHLANLKNQLSQAWDNAAFYVLDENTKGPTQFESNWMEIMYGEPMPYSKKNKLPELELWKSVSPAGRKRGDLGKVDKAFENALHKKYALQEIETRVAKKGKFASPNDKLALGKALQDYYRELSKCEVTCAGYMGNIWRNSKIEVSPSNIHGKVRSLGEQTLIQRKALQNKMLLLGMEPERISREEISALPFNEHHGKFSGLQGQEFLPDGPVVRL